MSWISIKDMRPDENETVWAYDERTGFVALACIVYADGWLWAVSNGVVYSEDGNIVSECELGDEYYFTHFSRLPKLLNSTK